MQASGLGPRPLGRLLGVSPYRIREWRRGVVPSWHYLSRLLTVAESMGLRHLLMYPEGNVSAGPPRRGGKNENSAEANRVVLHDHLEAGDN